VALVGIFASFHVVLYLMSVGLWRNWAIYLEPIEGIILGPWAGFSAALIGSMTARVFKPTDLWTFGVIAEPLGVLACGLLAKGRWKPTVAIYVLMLAAYFLHPLGRSLPIWAVLDILLALALIYPAAKLSGGLHREDIKYLSLALILISFVGIATDSLARVFLLIPMGFYAFFGWTPEVVNLIFITGAIDSYVEDVLVVIVSYLVGVPILLALQKYPLFLSTRAKDKAKAF
jgi:hypothetical protein